jgi:hypothetical protein
MPRLWQYFSWSQKKPNTRALQRDPAPRSGYAASCSPSRSFGHGWSVSTAVSCSRPVSTARLEATNAASSIVVSWLRMWSVADLLSQAKTTVAELLRHTSPGERLSVCALAADLDSDRLQAIGDSDLDETNDAEIERFCERVAERTGGEFVLVVNELMVVPGLGPVEHLMLAHYSGGTGIGGLSHVLLEDRAG